MGSYTASLGSKMVPYFSITDGLSTNEDSVSSKEMTRSADAWAIWSWAKIPEMFLKGSKNWEAYWTKRNKVPIWMTSLMTIFPPNQITPALPIEDKKMTIGTYIELSNTALKVFDFISAVKTWNSP